ncbi:helix-turn-helix transcriptional regulator [Desulfonatronospira thiodismutans]|uniref:helix-turn-helix transcriptional regulator n=1 Tax=Desulfonatronospira thiodismutans TaxID=488939 RepID=UPI0001974798|nr:WYL domain-containing protein [Desulfonatronospira thiodismutans]
MLARSLLDKSTGGYVSRIIKKFSRRLMNMTSLLGFGQDMMDKAFSAVWNQYSPAQAQVFDIVSQSLLNCRILAFDYTSPATAEPTTRKAEPHHLQHYMGSWVLIAFCLEKYDWRKFYLSRMARVTQTQDWFQPRPESEWSYQVESSFGIFQDRTSRPVVLRFSPFRARWIREQVWHPDQKMRELEDGSLELEIPVADFREIKLKILSFGADVEVIRPESLRREVAAEIQKMKKIYQK